jgi:lipopolysaccharide transport system ATP-binding protein
MSPAHGAVHRCSGKHLAISRWVVAIRFLAWRYRAVRYKRATQPPALPGYFELSLSHPMSDTVITVENLSKSYLVGHKSADQGYKRYTALRDVIGDEVRSFARNAVNIIRGRQIVLGDLVEEFWALKDVSFEVKRGEVLGIIGPNGAGKSTLLKILSRITEPTRGRVMIHGRVASLLEVGTGFHPELTGRENIYLNGAVLGMTRDEIRRKFDEIVAFAEVEKFLDTPVKRYSSGMYVRLAFAVAAHLEPEILIVDEVLAVGDAEFQKKCLGKMTEVAEGGRTVLFVSHNIPAIRHLCGRAILLVAGRKALDGASDKTIESYMQSLQSASLDKISNVIEKLPSDPTFRLRRVDIVQDGVSTTNVISGKSVEIVLEYDVFEEVNGLHVYFLVYDIDGSMLFESLHNGDCAHSRPTLPGRYVSRALIPANFLAGRTYELQISAAIHRIRVCIPQPSPINIRLNVAAVGLVNSAYPGYITPGKIAPLIPWCTDKLSEDERPLCSVVNS